MIWLLVSPLTRGRGLKLHNPRAKLVELLVAPHAGAWIETADRAIGDLSGRVAPHAGAWIETSGSSLGCTLNPLSPLTRGRGLKPAVGVRPLASQGSPLTRGRGLKLPMRPRQPRARGSPLKRGRGLKQNLALICLSQACRPSRGGVD